MPPPQHVWNGLARRADESMLVRDDCTNPARHKIVNSRSMYFCVYCVLLIYNLYTLDIFYILFIFITFKILQYVPYHIWAYYAHGRTTQMPRGSVSLPSGRLKTTRSSPHHVAQHRPTTGSETTPTPPYAPRSSRFGSEPPSVEDDVDVWRYAIASCMPETTSMYGAMSGSVS